MQSSPDTVQKQIELLAPAGSRESLLAAVNAGADAVYFGVGHLNMRSGGAVNFRQEELPEIVRICHDNRIRAYLTLNTIIYDGELDSVRSLCDAAKEADIDAVIAFDPAVILELRKRNIPVHISVQCSISNLESVRFYAQFADVMVLARELPLGSIAAIAEGIRCENICGPSGKPVRIEVFAHGALCIGISGHCGMSLCTYDRSSNRGACLQNCRRKYIVSDAETGAQLAIENRYVMSPKDICTIDFLDRILAAGVSVLKIEGRGRSADYVRKVVSTYRAAVDAVQGGSFTADRAKAWKTALAEVFNRGFWEGGYYLGNRLDQWCGVEGSIATMQKVYLGRIANYYPKAGVALLAIETQKELHPQDRIVIIGSSTGAVELTVSELRIENNPVLSAVQGNQVSFSVPERVRTGDKVYLLRERIAGAADESI